MSLLSVVLGKPETAAEEARRDGRLVHDAIADEWVEIEPLACRHTHVRIFADGEIRCRRCDKRE